jgi:hypothetical protein
VQKKTHCDPRRSFNIFGVVLYENANFGGRSQTLGIGEHRLSDFNEIASSIKVPKGLVALLYEHADAGGGYGIEVDVLEDRSDLSRLNFNDKLSYLTVVSSPDSLGKVWVRNSVQNGQFVSGHWEAPRASGTPVNMIAVVSPPVPPHLPAYQSPLPPPNVRTPILAKFRMLELHVDPPIFLDNTELGRFVLIYECRIETGPCSSRHDVRNVFWSIKLVPKMFGPPPPAPRVTNEILNVSGKFLQGEGNDECSSNVRRKYPHGGCLVRWGYPGTSLRGRGKNDLFSVTLALAGKGKTPYAQPDINDPETVVVDFLIVPAPEWPYLKIGGPRIRDHR